MSRSRSSSWRRFICTTLLWSLALLLITNVGWSVWFSQRFAEAYKDQFIRDLVGYPVDWPKWIETQGQRRVWISRSDFGGFESRWLSGFKVTAVSMDLPDFLSAGMPDHAPSRSLPRWVDVDRWRNDDRPLANGVAHEMYVGVAYPARLLWCRWVMEQGAWAIDRSTAINRTDDPQPWNGQVDEVLPFRPIWTGQLATAAIWFGAVLALRCLWYLVRFGLRDLRRSRELCAHCAYNLRGNTSGVCPECGTPAQPHP